MLTILQGDCREEMKRLAANSIDSCVTDPPYELGFMNKRWDKSGIAYDVNVWAEVLRVLKPGAHLLAFGGTRTAHRMAVAIEDAGFEIRDSIHWMYAQGFPKSLDVTKVAKKSGLYCNCKPAVIESNQDDKRLRNCASAPRLPQMGEHALRPLQDSDLSPSVNASIEQSQTVQPSLPQSGLQGDRRTRGESKTTRRKQSSLEGRRDTPAEARQLQADQVCSLPGGIPADGTEGRLCDGASLDSSASSEAMPNAGRGGASHESQPAEQSVLEPATVSEQQRPQTCRSCGKETFPEGLGTAVKPAHEIIYLARKPLSERSVFENVRRWGTGALNIDRCRISTSENLNGGAYVGNERRRKERTASDNVDGAVPLSRLNRGIGEYEQPTGRWPTNVILSHSPVCEAGTCHESCPVRELDRQSEAGGVHSAGNVRSEPGGGEYQGTEGWGNIGIGRKGFRHGDTGSASRFYFTAEWSEDDFIPLFYYVAKASRNERDAGLDSLDTSTMNRVNPGGLENDPRWQPIEVKNSHPTVKPVSLMAYLCRLITPPGGLILDPFAGSGTTGRSAMNSGFKAILIEQDETWLEVINARCATQLGLPL